MTHTKVRKFKKLYSRCAGLVFVVYGAVRVVLVLLKCLRLCTHVSELSVVVSRIDFIIFELKLSFE